MLAVFGQTFLSVRNKVAPQVTINCLFLLLNLKLILFGDPPENISKHIPR